MRYELRAESPDGRRVHIFAVTRADSDTAATLQLGATADRSHVPLRVVDGWEITVVRCPKDGPTTEVGRTSEVPDL